MNIQELLLDLSIHYNALIRKAASDQNLTASQAFHLISIPYDGISMSGLSNKLGLDTSTLTRNIQGLEKLGLIRRAGETYDKRIQKNFLTSTGLQAVQNINESLININHSLVENLDIETQEGLIENLEQLVWFLDCLRE